MATTSKIMIGIDGQVIELTGADKEAFLADKEQMETERLLLETEYKEAFITKNQGIKEI